MHATAKVWGQLAIFHYNGQVDSFRVSTPMDLTCACRVACEESWHGPAKQCFLIASTFSTW
jgi:hypothetical protein